MIGDFASKQFLIFLLTGGTAAAVNFGSRILYNLAVGYSSAIILAYLTGMVTAFVLAKLFVFRRSTQSLQRSALIFCLVNVLVIAGLHAVFLFTIATRKSVKVGAHQYGRQLILCCEHFIVDKAPKNIPQ